MANWQIITWRIHRVQICAAGSAGQLKALALTNRNQSGNSCKSGFGS
jgi:hypothetical protein